MKKIIIGLSAAVVLSTILLSKSFNDNFYLNCYFGNIFIITITLLFQIAVLLFSIKKNNINVSFSKNDIALLCWFVLSSVTLFMSGNSFNNHQYINFTLLLFLYFVFQYNLKNGFQDIIVLFSWILLTAGSFQLLYCTLQYFEIMKANTIFTVVGSFGNPGLVSIFTTLLFLWFFGVSLFNHSNKTLKIASSIYCLVASIFIISLTNRASWVVVVVCVPLILHFRYGIFSFFTQLSIVKKLAIVTTIVAGIIITIPFLYALKKDSTDGRLFIWQRTIEMIKDHPVSGVGFSNFETNYNVYQASYFKQHPNDAVNAHIADNIGYAFNEYLQTTSETGFAGLIIFLGVLFFAVTSLVKTKVSNEFTDEMVRALAQIIIIAYSIYSFVCYPLRTIPNSTLFFIFLSLASIGSKPLFSFSLNISIWRSLLGSVFVLFFIFLIFQANQLSYYKTWHKATIAMESGDRYGLTIMEELYPNLNDDKLFLYNYGTELSLAGNYAKSIEILEKAQPLLNDYNVYAYLGNDFEAVKRFDKAITCFEMADNLIPSRVYTKYRLFQLYFKTNDKRAIPMAQKVLDMPAKGFSDNVGVLRQRAKAFLDKYNNFTK